LRQGIANLLKTEVAAMNTENFIVRPKQRFVEKYANSAAWASLSIDEFLELSQEIAGLPSQLETETEEIKRFDVLMLKLQLAILRSDSTFKRLQEQVKSLAGLLEEKSAIPSCKNS
jgi:type I restriction enzyme R subunit